MAASRSLSQALDRRLRDQAGLSLSDFEVLAAIQRSPEIRMSDLAEMVSFSPSRLSHVVRRMEARGWVEACASPTDKRSKIVRLTQAGRGVLDRAWPPHARAIRDLFLDQITEDAREAFDDTLRRIRKAATSLSRRESTGASPRLRP